MTLISRFVTSTVALRSTILLLIVVVASPLMAQSQPEDSDASSSWPFLRGPDFDAVSKDAKLADSWPESGPPVLWTRELGQGYSSFVCFGDRVYTQYQSLSGQFVICLNAETGDTIWKHRYDWPYEAVGVYPGPRSTPTYNNGRVFYAAPSGLVGCVESEDGKPIWSLNLKEQFRGKGTDFGYASTPVVVGDRVIFPVGGKGASMVALRVEDGSIAWKSGDDPASYTPAIPISFQGKTQVLGYLENALVSCDPETGKQLWRVDLSEGYDEHSTWPVYQEPYLWISGPFRSGSRLLKLTSGEKPEEVWRSSKMSNDVVSSVLYDGHIYGFDLFDVQAKTHRTSRGIFRCIDLLTGDVKWSNGDGKPRRSREPDPDNPIIGHSSVLVADGKLVLFNDTGELILARATPEKYEQLARVELLGGQIVWTQPALLRNRLYVRNHSVAACVFLGQPEQLNSERDTPVLAVTDISQDSYGNLSSLILPVEREYVFDVPSMQVFLRWFAACMTVLIGSAFAAGTVGLVLKRRKDNDSSPRDDLVRPIFWLLAFSLGALGTTFLGRWLDELLFTWPVCLYVVFEALIFQAQLEKPTAELTRWQRWSPRVLIAVFAAVCFAYFLLCRRLSLLFEWSYLVGFPLASPLNCLTRKADGGGFKLSVARWLLTVAAFSAFYWSGVGLLAWKYGIRWQ